MAYNGGGPSISAKVFGSTTALEKRDSLPKHPQRTIRTTREAAGISIFSSDFWGADHNMLVRNDEYSAHTIANEYSEGQCISISCIGCHRGRNMPQIDSVGTRVCIEPGRMDGESTLCSSHNRSSHTQGTKTIKLVPGMDAEGLVAFVARSVRNRCRR